MTSTACQKFVPFYKAKVIKAQNQMIFTFTENQIQAVLKQPERDTFTGSRDYEMMLVLLETGIRVMELTNMYLSDIDFYNQTIFIPMGKGRKSRIVPIQMTCMKALMKFIQERGVHLLKMFGLP